MPRRDFTSFLSEATKEVMRNILIVLLIAFMVVSTGGVTVNAQTEPLKTQIALDTRQPVPVVTKEISTEPVKLVFDKNSPTPVLVGENKVEIVPGESNYTKEQRLAQEQRLASLRTRRTARVIMVPFKGDFIALYKAAASQYGLPWEILAAVHVVESGQSGDTTKRSYAGATGPMQFLPSTFRAYAVDGNGDGVASIYSVVDSVYTAARYISANLTTTGSIFGALYCYNHSTSYVYKVLSIARGFGYTG